MSFLTSPSIFSYFVLLFLFLIFVNSTHSSALPFSLYLSFVPLLFSHLCALMSPLSDGARRPLFASLPACPSVSSDLNLHCSFVSPLFICPSLYLSFLSFWYLLLGFSTTSLLLLIPFKIEKTFLKTCNFLAVYFHSTSLNSFPLMFPLSFLWYPSPLIIWTTPFSPLPLSTCRFPSDSRANLRLFALGRKRWCHLF